MVWFLCLRKEKSEAISKVYDLWSYAEGSNLLYPYAAFEITGSDATTKTALSELWNIHLARFRYILCVVPSREEISGRPDRMHVDRAKRIANTFMSFSSSKRIQDQEKKTFLLSQKKR